MMTRMLLAAAMGAALFAGPVQAATTVAWTFSGTHKGTGTLTYDETTDQLTAFDGAYDGHALSLVTFTSDPNNPSAELYYDSSTMLGTYRAVPNTNSANYTFDNKAHQTPDTQNFLVSTGRGDDEIVYNLGYDGPDFFFFNIVTQPQYAYVEDKGTFTMSDAINVPALPEPATWAMLTLGIGMVGGAMRSRRRHAKVTFTTAA